ncbi:MAG: thioredoxin family protein [Candidatus Delongbacteria bacterium]|jgi:thioredoxin 1|nr:thioredoxin family protein [Candidatus Delongbacteria bacterium]MDD4204915.1 thioredoxin family protein [Candidatus Delongbacteria bacterium]MDY0017313.1 thioredoxin family protein [Candidatus Delongbacteria bacterium]
MSNALKVTQSTFEQEVLSQEKLTIVKFGAEWCGPCKKLDPIIDEIAAENSDIKVTYVDIDSDGALAAQYGILSVPSTLFFKQGKVMSSIIGLIPKAKIQSAIDQYK